MHRAEKRKQATYLRAGQPHTSLGRLVAEEDDKLQEYYVGPEQYVQRALSSEDPAVFFRGPKGVGKSAILQMVQVDRLSDERRVIRISPDDLAFSALANVDATTPLLQTFDRNHWLYKTLWDYVLSVEILRREYPDIPFLFQKIFQGKQEKQARRLLNLSLADDGSTRTLTQRILDLVREVEISGEIVGGAQVSARVALGDTTPARGEHLSLLSQINVVAKSLGDHLRHTYFVLIDDLDLHWTDAPIQNAFIAALFASLKKLNGCALRFVVAIRDDIYHRLPLEDKDKSREWVCAVSWSRPLVQEMITKRVSFAVGCPESEVWANVFPHGAFNTMWNATRALPREVIRLSTLCLEEARNNGNGRVESADMASAVRRFSEEKIDDLGSERRHDLPGLDLLVRRFNGWPKEFPLERLHEFAIQVAIDVQDKTRRAPQYSWAGGYVDNPLGLARVLLECGVFLFKASRTAHHTPFDPLMNEDLRSDHWIAIHPIFAAGLGLVGES